MAFPVSDSAQLLEAFGFAVKYRDRQRPGVREVPSIEHVIEVAHLLDGAGVSDISVLVAAVLRDLANDGAATGATIGRLFGPEVRTLVEEVRPPHELTGEARRAWVLQGLKSAGLQVRVIQLADIVVTLRRLPSAWTHSQRERYFHWAGQIRVALAGTNARLESCFTDALRSARSTAASRTVVPITAMPKTGGGLRSLTEFMTDLRRVRFVLGRAEERLDDVIESLNGPCSGDHGHQPERTTPRRARKYTNPRLRESASAGVGALGFRTRDARTVFASLDHGSEFSLSPALADLLGIIASADKPGPDGFPHFQALDAVAAAMVSRGRHSSRRAVIVAINRLRGRLHALGHPPLLVETSVRHGVRFRLRL